MNHDLSQAVIWGVIIGMCLLNYAVRFPPMAIVSRIDLPPAIMRWLSFVPIAVMGALVASEVLTPGGAWANPLSSPSLYAAVVTALVYRFTRSFLGATLSGMASFVLFQHVIPALLG
ncbi:MAG: AzlD domain-containing protein [Coriobacteriia bacterium]|nr:AzlD domain-containing protein [Coriobacteriia bacterium]